MEDLNDVYELIVRARQSDSYAANEHRAWVSLELVQQNYDLDTIHSVLLIIFWANEDETGIPICRYTGSA